MATKAVSAPVTTKKTEIAKQAPKRITDEEISQILGLMEQGMSERKACETVGVIRPTFRQAVARHKAESQYARALATLAETKIEQIDQVIDMLMRGEIDPQVAKVVIDTHKWSASKLLPRKYGDKLDLTSDGKALPQPLLGGVTIEPNKELPQ